MSQSAVSPEMGPDLPGLVCLGLIGSGGFADVFLYERDQPRIRVAVKLMKLDAIDDAKRRQFAAEADAMAELAEHPYIVPVLGAGTAPDGRPYLIMRYYPSSDLATKVATQPLSVAEALRLGVQLASAVETAHRAGIIHRDIKPSNILVSSYDQPGLSDFGIAGRPSDSGDLDDQDVGVSIPWSPPEVLTGSSNGSVTSDVYSLAATVWHLLVGRAPFYIPGGDNGERATFTRIVHSRPPATGRDDAPASLDRLLQQAMAKDPAHRPQSALELARHFQRVEQELRLARTEAVVLNHAGTTVADGRQETATPSLPSPVDTPALDETVVGLTPSEAPSGPVVADASTQRPPRRVGPAQPTSTPGHRQWQLAATDADLDEDHGTDLASARQAGDAELSRPTELRPRLTPSVQTSTEPRPVAPRSSRRWLLAAAAVVALLVVGTGMLLGRGGQQPGQAGKGPRQSTDTSLRDAAPAAPADPSLRARVQGDHVVFTWPPVTGATGYQWTSATGQTHSTKGTRVMLPKSSSGRTCITVSSLGAGTPASPGRRACAS